MSGTPISEIRGGKNSELVNNILDNIEGNPSMPQPMPQAQQPMPPNGMPMQQQQEDFDDYDDLANMSLSERIMLEGKLPLVVAILIIVSNMDIVGKTIGKYVVKFISAGQADMATLVIKGLVGALVFYLVRRFLLPYS